MCHCEILPKWIFIVALSRVHIIGRTPPEEFFAPWASWSDLGLYYYSDIFMNDNSKVNEIYWRQLT